MEIKSVPNYPDSPDPNSFENGIEYQDLVCVELAKHGIILQNLGSKRYQLAVGENIQGFEIKLDTRCLPKGIGNGTGRLSIEIAEKSRASSPTWTPSGIYRNDNTWLYIQGNRRVLYIFAKSLLVALHKSGKYAEHEWPPPPLATVRKFYLPLELAERCCALKIELAPTMKVPGEQEADRP